MKYQPQINHLQAQINDANRRADKANTGVAMAMAMDGDSPPDKKKSA